MLVDERLAGKKGRCKACQQVITVPSLPASKPVAGGDGKAAAPPLPKPVDVEAEAAALFTDEPKPAESIEAKTIDVNCPFCDEPVHFSADLAGKRAPCPECTRIIKVPELEKKDPTDWRKVETRAPAGARLADQPELEGAWGSTSVRGVGRESLVEAGVIPKEVKPRTFWQKYRLPALGVSLLLVLGVGALVGYRLWSLRAVQRAVLEAVAYADSPDVPPEVKAALSLGASEYYLHSRMERPAVEANKQLGKAFNTLRSLPAGDQRDALFGDLALDQIELGGDKPETDEERRLPWDDIQKRLVATLGQIANSEARLQTLRLVAHRLRARGQVSRILPLTNQVYSAADADKAAALSVVGIECFQAEDRPNAERAADAALQPLPKGTKPLPLRAEVVALALLLEKKNVPEPGDNPDDKANKLIGKAEALARLGKWDAARRQARGNDLDEAVQFRVLLAIAAAAVDAKVPSTEDIEAAVKAGEGLGSKEELSWSLLRLTRLALRTSFPQERVQAMADKIGNPALRGRAQLAVFRALLDQSKEPVEDSVADKTDVKTLSRLMAALALARHNTCLNPNYAGVVQTWQQPLKSFGSLGVALGLQDREK
jgi:hypothetical protein